MTHIQIVDEGLIQEVREGVFTYSGWPSIIRAEDGALVVAYSGHRAGHVCPFGKEYIRRSYDEGKTWQNPMIVCDSPLDDRDAALVKMSGKDMAVNFFTLGRHDYETIYFKDQDTPIKRFGREYLNLLADDVDDRYAGRFVSISHDDGFTWEPAVRVPVFTPGGFKQISDGSYLIVSQRDEEEQKRGCQELAVYRSTDAIHWELISRLPRCENSDGLNHWEPDVAELPDGRLLCMIRMENYGYKGEENHIFTLAASYSSDKGYTWTVPKLLGNDGSPGGLYVHSSGIITCVYASRKFPYGIKAMISSDNGQHWEQDLPLFTPPVDTLPAGGHGDLGYPKSVELDNGDLFTVFYTKEFNTTKCAIRYVRWRIEA